MYFHPLLFRKLSLSHMVLGGSLKPLPLTQTNCQHQRKGSSNITSSWTPRSWVITLMCSYLIFYEQKYLWPNKPWEMELSGQSHLHYFSSIIYIMILLSLYVSVRFSSVAQSCPTLCDSMDCSTQAYLSITNSRSLLKFMFIESVMPSNHQIHCRPLLLLPPIFQYWQHWGLF